MTELLHQVLTDPQGLDIVDDLELHGAGAWSRPAAPSELSEWATLLDAIEGAEQRFTMFELGAGYGRWTVIAAALLRRYRPELRHRFIAVEAEPTHYRWLRRYTRANGLHRWSRAGSTRLIQAAVSAHAGRDDFHVGKPAEWYGQQLVRPEHFTLDEPVRKVRTVTLSRLLAMVDHVDLIDLDVQGAELEVLFESAPALGRVRRLYVEAHTASIDEQLLALGDRAEGDWRLTLHVPFGGRHDAPLGVAEYPDSGVQVWRNDAV